MMHKLEPIILHKQREIAVLKNKIQQHPNHLIGKILRGEVRHSATKRFKQTLLHSSPAVIAEIKRKSPSNGVLAAIADPVALARTYIAGGANAISILTEDLFFGGRLEDLISVARELRENSVPILRKDFILDVVQVAESLVAGADAILCIVAALGKTTKTIIDCARTLGIDVLVEVIDHHELDIAIESGAEIIGVNNRNLKTFEVDTQRAMQLVSDIPDHIVKVAASGISYPSIAKQYYDAGFHAVLIGEALVKSADASLFIQECRHDSY